MFIRDITESLLLHVVQSTFLMLVASCASLLLTRRWPSLAFGLLMLSLLKCLTPPLIKSPFAVVAWSTSGCCSLLSSIAISVSDVGSVSSNAVASQEPGNHSSSISNSEWGQNDCFATASNNLVPEPIWMLAVAIFWLSGVAFLAIHLSLKAYRLRAQRGEYWFPADADLQEMLDRERRALAIRQTVRMLVSRDNFGPSCLGVFRPAIVLPHHLVEELGPSQIRPIMAHELVHIQRRDPLLGYLQLLAQIVWWFHPLVRWVARRANVLCEYCVDDTVVAKSCTRTEYAESLVHVIRLRQTLRSIGLAISPSQLTVNRLQRICGPIPKASCPFGTLARNLLLVVACGLALPAVQWQVPLVEVSQGASETTLEGFKEQTLELLASRDWSQAELTVRSFLEQNPDDAQAAFWLGYIWLERGDCRRALMYLRRATSDRRLQPLALYHMSRAHGRLGNKQITLELLGKSLDRGFAILPGFKDEASFSLLRDVPEFQNLVRHHERAQAKVGFLSNLDYWYGTTRVVSRSGYARRLQESGNTYVGPSLATESAAGLWNTGDEELQLVVDQYGQVIEMDGCIAPSEIQLVDATKLRDGGYLFRRTELQVGSKQEVRQSVSISYDRGESWLPVIERHYARATGSPVPEI